MMTFHGTGLGSSESFYLNQGINERIALYLVHHETTWTNQSISSEENKSKLTVLCSAIEVSLGMAV